MSRNCWNLKAGWETNLGGRMAIVRLSFRERHERTAEFGGHDNEERGSTIQEVLRLPATDQSISLIQQKPTDYNSE